MVADIILMFWLNVGQIAPCDVVDEPKSIFVTPSENVTTFFCGFEEIEFYDNMYITLLKSYYSKKMG